MRPEAMEVSDELGDKLTGVNVLPAADTDSPDERDREEGSPMCPMIMLLDDTVERAGGENTRDTRHTDAM